MKKQHLSQLETMDYELTKLKEILNGKNEEINSLWSNHNNVKKEFEEDLIVSQHESDNLKRKII